MNCHVIYTGKTGGAKVNSFNSIISGLDWIADCEGDDDYSSMQLVVDYTVVDVYKEKYDLMFERLLTQTEDNNIKPKLKGA